MKRTFLIFIIIVSILIVSACGLIGKNGGNEEENPGVSNPDQDTNNDNNRYEEEAEGPTEEPEDEESKVFGEDKFDFKNYKSIISEEETPYVLVQEDGSKVFLHETSPEVIALSIIIGELGKALNDIDWETATGWEHYELLTPESKRTFEEENEDQMMLDFYRTYKVKSKFLGVEHFNSIEFSGDEAIADVVYAFIYENVENLANYEIGKPYYVPTKFRYKLIDGKWLLDEMLEVGQIYHYEEE